MPRNGDGSSDNGPIEGHDIVHGASGDVRCPQISLSLSLPDMTIGNPPARKKQRRPNAGT